MDYLDEDDELRLEVVKRLSYYTSVLLDGTITQAAVDDDWAEWFDLVGAFVVAYAPEAEAELGEEARVQRRRYGSRPAAERGGPGLLGGT